MARGSVDGIGLEHVDVISPVPFEPEEQPPPVGVKCNSADRCAIC